MLQPKRLEQAVSEGVVFLPGRRAGLGGLPENVGPGPPDDPAGMVRPERVAERADDYYLDRVGAGLNVLGYDVASITYGVNGLNYDGLYAGGKPTWHGPENYEYVVD